MGGSGNTTTSEPIIPDELKEIYRLQTDFAKSQLPAIQQLTTDVLSGKSLATNPYISGLYASLQRGADVAAEQIRQRTARGPAQDYAVAQAYRAAGEKRGELDARQRQNVLQQLYSILGGYNPQKAIGGEVSKPAATFDMGLGPFSFNYGL